MARQLPRIKVWDSFIRCYHWLMVALFGALWWSGENGEMSLHQDFATALAALLVVRLGWGFFGSDNARFNAFLTSPLQVLAHLKKLAQRRYSLGNSHSAAGGWAVVLMLLLLTAQIITGLFASDGILFSGPLNSWVDSATADFLTDWHKTQFNVLLAVMGVHVVAIVVYRLLGVRLLAAMVTGYRYSRAPQPQLKSGWQALLLVVAVWFLLTLLW